MVPPERSCCAVGLTGGLATGKSTVARVLADRGVAVLDADRVVHGLYRSGGAAVPVVAELFGDAVIAEGAVDREALARRVLADPAALRRLESAVHPLVRAEIREWLAGRPAEEPAVVEASLLVETGSWRDYDLLMVVWCRAEQQLDRALARGMPRARAEQLLEAQLPVDAKRRYADVLVDNSGDLEDLLDRVAEAWQEVVAGCRRRGPVAGHSSGGSSHSVA